MRRKSIKKIPQVLLILLSIIFFVFGTTPVMAATTPTTTEVYQAIPNGIASNEYITKDNTYNDGTVNSAKLYKAGSAEYNNSVDLYQMLDDNGDKQQTSSIWGKRPGDAGATDSESDNYFDLDKDQSVTAWIYFGDRNPYDGVSNTSDATATDLADGMAFVLQADTRGSKAIGTNYIGGKTAFGQGLGVWGSIIASGMTLGGPLKQGTAAIQNSFALEFDTFQNATGNNTTDNFFDGLVRNGTKVVKGQHMAWNYPAGTTGTTSNDLVASDNTDTYLANPVKTNYYYGLNHLNPKNSMYITGYTRTPSVTNSWQNFTINYYHPAANSTTAYVSYHLNNKQYDGSLKPDYDSTTQKKMPIDISPLIVNGNKKVRWGFTASTGSPGSSPLTYAMVMQEMPNIANIDGEVKLFDLSQYDSEGNLGREILDAATLNSSSAGANNPDYSVANGDKLRLDYTLDYDSGFAGTGGEITTVMNLPKNVSYPADASGNIGEITYSGFKDAANNKTVPIPASALSADGQLNLSLSKMDEIDQKAKITIYGTANAPTTPIKVDREHTSYRSLHYMEDVMSPAFYIKDRLNLTTTDNLDLGSINTGDSTNDTVNLNLTTSYDKGTNFDTKGVTLYTQVDDKTPKATTNISTATGATSYNIANNIANSTQFTAQTLGSGDHTIKVYVVDSMNRTSDPITYKVRVTGKELKLTVSNNTDFQDVNYKATNGIINRKGKWVVSVDSTDTPWILTASAPDLTLNSNNSQTLGPLIFRDKNNNDFSLASGSQTIASDSQTNAKSLTTDVSSAWGNTDGILLKNDTVVPAGQYSGKITWNLIDSTQ